MKVELHTSTLADKVEQKIMDYIRDNNLVLGDSLPSEIQFVEIMGTSRNVVREAMSRLRMLGLIQTRPKRGIVITEPPLLNVFKKVIYPDLMSLETIKELIGMRIVIEIGITDLLFAKIDNIKIEELERVVSRQQAIGI